MTSTRCSQWCKHLPARSGRREQGEGQARGRGEAGSQVRFVAEEVVTEERTKCPFATTVTKGQRHEEPEPGWNLQLGMGLV